MAALQYLSRKELHADTTTPVELTGDPQFKYNLARRMPHLLQEHKINFGEGDKVFASEWLTENEVILGTKCNKLYVLDTSQGTKVELPLIGCNGFAEDATSCGLHCIALHRDAPFLATGGSNANNLAIYSLPNLEPSMIGLCHKDWIFDIQWISDSLLITGSRDSTMALWTVSSLTERQPCLAENAPRMEPVFRFSNTGDDSDTRDGERIRSLAYHSHSHTLASLQSNPCGALVFFWDALVFQQFSKICLPFRAENVCLEVDNDNTQLYAVGSRSHISFIDGRAPSNKLTGSVCSPDKECGVRSLQFNQNLLSIGTGAGNLYFYDMRTHSYLVNNCHSTLCHLKASHGYLREDQTFREYFSGVPDPSNAIYTHCYSPQGTKIFTAGGPLPLGLCGNYTAVWV